MAVSYDRLWKLLIDRHMSKADLRRDAALSPNTLTRLQKEQPVTFAVLDKICHTLGCDYGDIISYVPDTDEYICPECGGKLDVMWVEKMPGLLAGSDVVAACSQCELDWKWHRQHDGTPEKKQRFFHG